MFTPKQLQKKLTHQNNSLPCRFSVLVWNVHKENQTKDFQMSFSALMQTNPSDILLLQEVKYHKNQPFIFDKYSFVLGTNIETKQHLFGVLTAAKCSFHNITSTLSSKKELGFSTHKSFLITQHTLCNAQTLYFVNIHAVNFVSHKIFAHELQKIKNLLLAIDGPLLIGGDFNNWNKKRLTILKDFQEELALYKLSIEEPHHIKQIFSQTIDHIYYRGLKPIKAIAINTKKISDHNPIYAVFELEE
ncbi:endonuclease/exonuclease/phosphatase family protein [Sulfurimonas sp.]